MSGSSLLPLQEAIYDILTNDHALMDKVTGIFDYVPDNQNFPYVVIGEYITDFFETFDRFGQEVMATIHVWSRYKGMKEVEEIMDDLNRLLARKFFVIPKWIDVGTFLDYSETIVEPDGITRHGIVRYRILALQL